MTSFLLRRNTVLVVICNCAVQAKKQITEVGYCYDFSIEFHNSFLRRAILNHCSTIKLSKLHVDNGNVLTIKIHIKIF